MPEVNIGVVDWLRLIHPGGGILGLAAFPRSSDSGAGPRTCAIDLDLFGPGQDWAAEVASTIAIWDQNSKAERDRSVRVRFASFMPASGAGAWAATRVSQAKTWMVDLDAHDRSHRPAAQLAVGAVTKLSGHGIPPPSMIMDSGWGAHLLWIAERPLPAAHWRKIADALAAAVERAGIDCDLQVTRDPTRSLRPPGTINWRDPDDPRVVRILAWTGRFCALPQLEALPEPARAHEQLPPHPPVAPWTIAAARGSCAVLDYLLTSGGKDCSEPQWRASLQLAAFADDGDVAAHDMSAMHPEYDRAATNRKLQSIRLQISANPSIGPHSCETLASLFPGRGCHDCAVRRQVRSPADIPNLRTALPTSRFVVVPKDRLSAQFRRPGLYQRKSVLTSDRDTGDTKTEWQWEWVAPYIVSELELLERAGDNGVEQSEILFRDLGGKFNHLHHINLLQLDSPRMVTREASRAGLAPPGNPQAFWDFLVEIREKLRENNRPPVAKLGFNSDMSEFLMGDWIISRDRAPQKTSRPPSLSPLSGYYSSGDLEAWKDLAAMFLKDTRPAVHAVVGAAAGAPLTSVIGCNSVLCVLTSSHTGVGKTALLALGQSMWGHPNALGLGFDTPAAISERLRSLNHVPMFLDETRDDKNSEQLTNMIFLLEAGRSRNKMLSPSTLSPTWAWRTVIFMSSNYSILAAIQEKAANSPAIARVLQLALDDIDKSNQLPLNTHKNFELHHGLAGVELTKYMLKFKREDHFKQMMGLHREFLGRVTSSIATPLTETEVVRQIRFAVDLATIGLYGGRIARDSGVLPGWNESLATEAYLRMCRDIIAAQEGAKAADSIPYLLTLFVSQYRGRCLTRPSDPRRAVYLPTVRNEPVVGEIDLGTGKVYILYSALQDWLRKSNFGHMAAAQALLTDKSMCSRRSIGAGLPTMCLPEQPVLEIGIDKVGIQPSMFEQELSATASSVFV